MKIPVLSEAAIHAPARATMRRGGWLRRVGTVGLVLFAPLAASAAGEAAGALLKIDNGVVAVGVDRGKGGSITWLSAAAHPGNMVNIKDPGRLIQQSYYAGLALDRSAEGQNAAWRPWRWNPIQGGGVGSWASNTVCRRVGEGLLYGETVPRLWDMPAEEAAARMLQWTSFEPGMPDVVAVRCEFISLRPDNDRWGPARQCAQEVPACYFTRNFGAVRTYLGHGTWRDERQPAGPPWGHTVPPLHAMAVFTADGYGIGVYSPGSAGSWAFGPHGRGATDDPAADACMHVSPHLPVALGPTSIFRYRYWLVLGTASEIAARFDALIARHAGETSELAAP